jgi:hypothetical protein
MTRRATPDEYADHERDLRKHDRPQRREWGARANPSFSQRIIDRGLAVRVGDLIVENPRTIAPSRDKDLRKHEPQLCPRCGSVLSIVTWTCVRGKFCPGEQL